MRRASLKKPKCPPRLQKSFASSTDSEILNARTTAKAQELGPWNMSKAAPENNQLVTSVAFRSCGYSLASGYRSRTDDHEVATADCSI